MGNRSFNLHESTSTSILKDSKQRINYGKRQLQNIFFVQYLSYDFKYLLLLGVQQRTFQKRKRIKLFHKQLNSQQFSKIELGFANCSQLEISLGISKIYTKSNENNSKIILKLAY
ncbi:hypothetical protein TTHERM_000418289 (macronuclear) [Tetrahymena thermophila SB210]|uniref:Uncharacterized protein n=1 Tax=Tetrahymena thermophila (strain SB210) TaxID=312017 RepID=W7XH98_TETTS|nr:hypothetical protein TTHERM_000418289 [Tetrahymena thermophila SB210]EWS76568.1 hypothetical protein TTHERM_000418289 [Tetrahymena thermophila SB210]|eukprot:XP_012650854.1 hypothetical protein TTHERM_000418289 [Tetrahymena thermophila SB210]